MPRRKEGRKGGRDGRRGKNVESNKLNKKLKNNPSPLDLVSGLIKKEILLSSIAD